jgi:putative DNA primase/helicase
VNFCLIAKGEKKPFEKEWQQKKIEFDDDKLIAHIASGGNYGVRGGGDANLLIVDFDDEKVQAEVINVLPKTLTIKTGRGLLHKYYKSDKAESFKIFTENLDTILDVQGEGKQVVGAGSIHPNGNKYEIVDDSPIAYVPHAELKAIIMPYNRKPKKEEKKMEKPVEYSHDNFLDVVKSRVRIEDVLREFGVDTSKNPTNCPFHDSKAGKCLGFKDEVAHCFHCEDSWNIFSLVKKYKNMDFKDALLWIVDKFNLQKEHEESRKHYIEYLNSDESNRRNDLKLRFLELVKDDKTSMASELIVQYILEKNYIYTTKDDIKSEIWIYNDGIYLPQGRSEIKEIMREILGEYFNQYYFGLVVNKIEPDTYIESKKFFGTNYPEEIPVKNGILNIFTRKLSTFTPKKIFFNKLPVTYNPIAICPAIDLFLNDVLASQEDKKVFYELAGSALLKEYRFEKAFMFVGNGRNGKGKSLELLKRLVGAENCASLPLSSLLPDSFNTYELFGKLLNLAGDIGNKDLQDTSYFKALTGRDLVTTKRKFLTAITFENYAKFVFACNELPNVYDTSRGFWDRWVLMEFPFTFVSQDELDSAKDKAFLKLRDENIIQKIVCENEMSGLLNQALDGLQRIIKHKGFSTTRGTKEIKETWIRKANSAVAFAIDFLDEDSDNYIMKKEFRKQYAIYCKKHGVSNKSDFVIKKVLQEMYGVNDERIKIGIYPNEQYSYVWQGVKWKHKLIGLN